MTTTTTMTTRKTTATATATTTEAACAAPAAPEPDPPPGPSCRTPEDPPHENRAPGPPPACSSRPASAPARSPSSASRTRPSAHRDDAHQRLRLPVHDRRLRRARRQLRRALRHGPAQGLPRRTGGRLLRRQEPVALAAVDGDHNGQICGFGRDSIAYRRMGWSRIAASWGMRAAVGRAPPRTRPRRAAAETEERTSRSRKKSRAKPSRRRIGAKPQPCGAACRSVRCPP